MAGESFGLDVARSVALERHKAEVIAARKLTAGAIMLEVLKRFQPLSEKSALRTCRRRGQCGRCGPGTGTSSQMWSGASELAVTLPDPVVLLHAFAVCGCPGKGAASVVPHRNVATPAWAGCQG